ncbi:hypothetical protein HKD37_05G011997 [Glycine soja]
MGTSPPYKNESEELPLHRNLPSPLLPIVSFIYLLNQVLPFTFCVLDFSSSNEMGSSSSAAAAAALQQALFNKQEGWISAKSLTH